MSAPVAPNLPRGNFRCVHWYCFQSIDVSFLCHPNYIALHNLPIRYTLSCYHFQVGLIRHNQNCACEQKLPPRNQ